MKILGNIDELRKRYGDIRLLAKYRNETSVDVPPPPPPPEEGTSTDDAVDLALGIKYC